MPRPRPGKNTRSDITISVAARRASQWNRLCSAASIGDWETYDLLVCLFIVLFSVLTIRIRGFIFECEHLNSSMITRAVAT